MINQFKNRFVVGDVLLSMFDYYDKIPLQLIFVQRLNIASALGVLR